MSSPKISGTFAGKKLPTSLIQFFSASFRTGETCHAPVTGSRSGTDVNVPAVNACQTCHNASQAFGKLRRDVLGLCELEIDVDLQQQPRQQMPSQQQGQNQGQGQQQLGSSPEDSMTEDQLRDALKQKDVEAIIVNGGTGIAPRDGTYEVIVKLLEKRLDGFGEIFRFLSYQDIGSAAIMSRAVAGSAQGKILISLPGSKGAVGLAMEKLILPELRHIVSQLQGQ